MFIRIVLAEDHAQMRVGLSQLIDQTSDMGVAATADDGPQAVELARALKPDIVIMSVGLPHLNGVDAVRQITGEMSTVGVIALSMNRDARFADQIMEAGARGFVIKDDAFEEIIEAISQVHSGGRYISKQVERLA